jgi:hypothetical protein
MKESIGFWDFTLIGFVVMIFWIIICEMIRMLSRAIQGKDDHP